MKFFKKILSVLVVFTFILSVSSINVFAATTTQDGLEVTFTTDKSSYSNTDDIVTTLTVKNTNDFEVTNLSLENLVPDGYKVTDKNSLKKEIERLESGKDTSLVSTYESTKTVPEPTNATEGTKPIANVDGNAINTGNNSGAVIVICLLVLLLSIFSIFIFQKKKVKQLFSLTLVCALMLSYVSIGTTTVNAAETQISNSINIETPVTIGNNSVKLKGLVNYSINKTNSYTVTFVSNGGSNVEAQEVIKGGYVVPPIPPIKEGSIFGGWYTSPELTERFNFNEFTVSKDLTLWAKWLDNTDEQDTDSDGLFDVIEYKFGTDVEKSDTDGDGLSDYFEMLVSFTDPLNNDTDKNGTKDGDEDFDHDTLSNLNEFKYETNPYIADSDEDGLTDAEEINTYKTNPKEKDTDSDKVSDGKEIEIGSDPLVAEENFNVNTVSTEEDTVKASVITELTGEQVETLEVKKYDNTYYFPETMPGYIGGAYDFHVEGKFDSAKIQFEFDKSLLDTDNFDPAIYYFNEETQLLEVLDTTITGNVASANVTHFSKYILLNRTVYENSFEWQDVWDTNGYSGVEIVLVIDDSGSMGGNDSSNQRLTVAQNLIDKLPDNSKVGVVKFTSSTSTLTTKLTNDKESAKQYLTTDYFHSSGGTRMYSAINSSFTLFESTDDKILKMMVVLTDGNTGDAGMHSSVISTANDNKVKIYTVGLGNSVSYFNDYLKPLANNTSGAFYLSSDAAQLQSVYDDINKKIDIETDSDNDGIADFYEENMVMFNGINIKLDKNNPDSDGDGLSDGEEVAELNYQYNADKTQVIVTGKLLSNPLEEDTDGDGVSDEEELLIGTNPALSDTDGDGLDDGLECSLLYDPLNKDPDNDNRLDLQEYNEGSDPYTYDKNWYEHIGDFLYGFICGDFIEDTDSFPVMAGQITSSCIPVVGTVGDIRDALGNLVHGDYLFAGLSVVGLAPAFGDGAKLVGKVGKFVVKNVDDVPKIANLLEFLNKNAPDIVKALNKSDDFIDAAKALSKADNIKLTRTQMKVINETFENAGLSHYLIKTSNSLELEDAVKASSDFWAEKPIKRGQLWDDLINGHSSGAGVLTGKPLGQNFPVVDRLLVDERILVSTKSLDVSLKGYQNPRKLEKVLNDYAKDLRKFETNKHFDEEGILTWGKIRLSTSDYDTKVIEIILPDTIITEDSLRILNQFREKTHNKKDDFGNIVKVWYRIGK